MKLSLEARVGLLVLVAMVLLGGFVFLLGGIDLREGFAVHVDFDNPGAVQPGAPVRVGGVRVGRVEEVRYMGRRLDTETGRRPLVRIRLSIDRDVRETIHDDALFYVTSQGVLGEQFMAVDPGTHERPPIAEGAIMRGVDPPRLDLALALGYELLETLVGGVRANREELGSLLDDVVALIRAFREILEQNRDRISHIVENVDTVTEEGVALLRGARQEYVEGPRPQRMLARLDRLSALLDRETGPLLGDVRGVATSARETLDTIGPDERRELRETIHAAARVAASAERATQDAERIVAHVRGGQGTVGSLLMDEEIYDDLQELIRDLKHNPWKFFWRE
jgi:phospholipid/cholesterol/gamma-HCH transport system substrate-binding protein